MRTAILCALAMGVCLASYAADGPAPKPDAGQSQQDAPAKKPDSAATPAKSTTLPPASETDPLKIAAPQSDGTPKPEANAPISEKTYVIGAEDVLNITVWNSQPLSGSHTVRPDGRISMPLVGEIMAAGKTPLELETEITGKLKSGNIIKTPNVAVSVAAVNSKKYYLEGEVNKPGQYNLIVPTTVLQALVNAGGFKDFANQTHIRILRGKETFNFNYKQVIKNQHTEQNIYLEPGDIIIVK
ncbi:MAG: polysaccharide biosynthesis/export family protein [Bryobacteraceae bacterium]